MTEGGGSPCLSRPRPRPISRSSPRSDWSASLLRFRSPRVQSCWLLAYHGSASSFGGGGTALRQEVARFAPRSDRCSIRVARSNNDDARRVNSERRPRRIRRRRCGRYRTQSHFLTWSQYVIGRPGAGRGQAFSAPTLRSILRRQAALEHADYHDHLPPPILVRRVGELDVPSARHRDRSQTSGCLLQPIRLHAVRVYPGDGSSRSQRRLEVAAAPGTASMADLARDLRTAPTTSTISGSRLVSAVVIARLRSWR